MVGDVLRIGLTGGAGAGKSTVARELARLGAVVIDADEIAREVVAPGTPALRQVIDTFGDQLLRPDGELDRSALADIVFTDPDARRRLNAIVHPLVRQETAARLRRLGQDAIVVHDVPLIVENDLADEYDLVVVVGAGEETRIERLVSDRGMSAAEARSLLNAQATDAERRAVADVWLDNSTTRQALLPQVRRLWRERILPAAQGLSR